MTIDSIGPVGVQARILEIQRRFTPAAPVASGAAAGNGTAGTGSTATASFASALAGFLPGADVGSAQATTGPASAFPASTFPGAGEQVVADAKRYLGVPYVWGGTDPAKGLDCSGLVQRVYADLGVDLPRVAADQARAGQPVASLADARPGDLLAFGSPVDHIGKLPCPAFLIAGVSRNRRVSNDSAIGVLFAGAFALGVAYTFWILTWSPVCGAAIIMPSPM